MTSNERRPLRIGGWVAIGIGVGVAMDNVPLWPAVGGAVGVAIGARMGARSGGR